MKWSLFLATLAYIRSSSCIYLSDKEWSMLINQIVSSVAYFLFFRCQIKCFIPSESNWCWNNNI